MQWIQVVTCVKCGTDPTYEPGKLCPVCSTPLPAPSPREASEKPATEEADKVGGNSTGMFTVMQQGIPQAIVARDASASGFNSREQVEGYTKDGLLVSQFPVFEGPEQARQFMRQVRSLLVRYGPLTTMAEVVEQLDRGLEQPASPPAAEGKPQASGPASDPANMSPESWRQVEFARNGLRSLVGRLPKDDPMDTRVAVNHGLAVDVLATIEKLCDRLM